MHSLKISILEFNDHFLVRSESSHGGEGEEKLTFNEDLEQLLCFDPDNSPFRSIHILDDKSSKAISTKSVGSKLFKIIFVGEIFGIYRTHLSLDSKTILQLDLSSSPSLINVPWELLYDDVRNSFVGLSNKIYLTRYLSLSVDRKSPKLEGEKFTILVVISHEVDLNSDKEWEGIKGIFSKPSSKSLVSVVRLKKVTFKGLQEASLSIQPNVVHFIGHGDYNKQEKTAYIRFKDRSGHVEDVSAEKLVYALGTMQHLKLLVLNSCDGSLTVPSEIYKGLTHKLLQLGVPSVISMQSKINDRAAIVFSERLYSCLVASQPLELAVTESRKSIYSVYGQDKNWYSPVLYTRSKNNLLFDFSKHESYLEIYRSNKKRVGLVFLNLLAILLGLGLISKTYIYKNSEIVIYDQNHKRVAEADVSIPDAKFQGKTSLDGKVNAVFFLPGNESVSGLIAKEGFELKEFLLYPGANIHERIYKKP